ncbi:MAG TPA: NADH-quinone oxidoreductase subunit NuoE [Gammaproteobacteria bacterium]|nr:NADH-quinone oxidoreductase subunit NuoE [Gammaproteobacteria bacterium]
MNSDVIASSETRARKLSAEEIAEIEHEMTLYPDKQAVGLEALKIVQKHQGWVSDESLLAIARYLDLPVANLEGVATFFNLIYRQPVGKNVMLLCDSVSCWIMGCEGIKEDIKNKLAIDYGQTTEDGEFTLIPVPCLGDCDRAPVMMVGEELHRNLTPEKIDEIVQETRDKKLARDKKQETRDK